jgi:hypothetical protein
MMIWHYRVVFKGNKKDLEFDLPDNQLLLDWNSWDKGDTSKQVSDGIFEKAAAVINFTEISAIVAYEIQEIEAFPSNPSRPPLTSRASGFFGPRN